MLPLADDVLDDQIAIFQVAYDALGGAVGADARHPEQCRYESVPMERFRLGDAVGFGGLLPEFGGLGLLFSGGDGGDAGVHRAFGAPLEARPLAFGNVGSTVPVREYNRNTIGLFNSQIRFRLPFKLAPEMPARFEIASRVQVQDVQNMRVVRDGEAV